MPRRNAKSTAPVERREDFKELRDAIDRGFRNFCRNRGLDWVRDPHGEGRGKMREKINAEVEQSLSRRQRQKAEARAKMAIELIVERAGAEVMIAEVPGIVGMPIAEQADLEPCRAMP